MSEYRVGAICLTPSHDASIFTSSDGNAFSRSTSQRFHSHAHGPNQKGNAQHAEHAVRTLLGKSGLAASSPGSGSLETRQYVESLRSFAYAAVSLLASLSKAHDDFSASKEADMG
jgi:hypothetical protein